MSDNDQPTETQWSGPDFILNRSWRLQSRDRIRGNRGKKEGIVDVIQETEDVAELSVRDSGQPAVH